MPGRRRYRHGRLRAKNFFSWDNVVTFAAGLHGKNEAGTHPAVSVPSV